MQIVGLAVTRLRWGRGWSISELARNSGVAADTIAKIEDGESKGSPKTAKSLADALGVQVIDICGERQGDDVVVIPLGAVGQAAVQDMTKGELHDNGPTAQVG